jgi:hypothetical protein
LTATAGSGSDHYHFALMGVPYVFFFTGTHACYHATCDTVDLINFPDYVKITRTIARLTWTISQADTNPRSDFVMQVGLQEVDTSDWQHFQDFVDHKVTP